MRGFRNYFTGRDSDNIIKGDFYQKIGNFNVSAFEEWHDIVASIANIKQLFEIRRAEAFEVSPYLKLTSSLQVQQGEYAKCPVCLGESGKEFVVINGVIASYNNNDISRRSNSDPIRSYSPVSYRIGSEPTETALPPISRCPVCEGTGLSPSSMDGIWIEESKKSYNEYMDLYADNITKLAAIEEKMGLGGSQIIDITKNKIESIGLVMNDFGSIRIDTIGKIYNDAVFVDNLGVYEHKKESPMLEYVHVDDMPGGTYTLNVANRYNVQVGAGGLSLKSYGRVDVSGTITNVGGQQVNISSENEVNINGGERLTLEANIVSIKNKQSGQVLVDSNFGVNGNVVVRGGLHVDGELSVNHITAPTEFQETEQVILYGELVAGTEIGIDNHEGSTVKAKATPNSVKIYAHSHHFRNIPLTLTDTNSQVREIAKANNETEINAATEVNNRKKTYNENDPRS